MEELLVQAVKHGFIMRPRRFIPHHLYAQGKGVFVYLKGRSMYTRGLLGRLLWSEWLHLSHSVETKPDRDPAERAHYAEMRAFFPCLLESRIVSP